MTFSFSYWLLLRILTSKWWITRNAVRKDFTVSELGSIIEEIQKRSRKPGRSRGGNLPQLEGEVRENVSKILSRSHTFQPHACTFLIWFRLIHQINVILSENRHKNRQNRFFCYCFIFFKNVGKYEKRKSMYYILLKTCIWRNFLLCDLLFDAIPNWFFRA